MDGSAIDYESEQNMSENCDENDTSYISDSNGASDNTNTSSDGASDDTDTNSDDYSIESLRKKYPEYFSLDTMKGLEVYVWQMAHGLYSCVLLPGKNSLYSYGDILQYKSVSMEIMASIVASYELPRESVTIIPISMPHSSYYYPIDDEHIENTEALFWSYCN